MEANDLWYMFKGCLAREEVEEMIILGRALRNHIERRTVYRVPPSQHRSRDQRGR